MQRLDTDPFKLRCSPALFNEKTCCKDLSQRWIHRKTSGLWKLIILMALGLSGMYICISGVERRLVHHKRLHDLSFIRSSSCTEQGAHLATSLLVHYPQPLTYNREDCTCTPVHYFVVFSMQRSGSGWFETLLNSHPNISSHGEVFSVERRRESVGAMRQTLDTVYNLDWVSSASKNDCTAAVGLKWMLNQGVMEFKDDVAAYLQDKSVSVIFLFRQNLIRRYVSILANSFDRAAKQLNGTHRAHVHSKEEAKVLAAYKPVVNLTSLIQYLQRVEEITRDACSFFNKTRHMTIYYEDLVANPQKELRRAQKFLGVMPASLESKHVKIHTWPLKDQIDNWADLSTFLKGTKYESFLKGKDYT